MVGLVSCGSSDDGADGGSSKATTTTVADAGGDPTTTAADGGGASGSTIEAAVSSGATLSGKVDVCTIDGTSGTVIADDRNFELTFADGQGDLTWTYDGGALRESPAVAVAGSTITLSGTTDDGLGYNAEITCA
ncbi:MAG: hypothetical protein U0P45_12075 [Acidimicrobiales bacterium]